MNNILVYSLPEEIVINGVEYTIASDFKTTLLSILAYEDNELTLEEKHGIALNNFYQENIPEDINEAYNKWTWFLLGGADREDDETAPRLYSISKDANLIFAAFRQTHGIDLEETNMHWWKFLALFMDLGQDTFFCQLVALRKKAKEGKLSLEEKTAIRELGSRFEVPEIETLTLEELEAEEKFMKLLLAERKTDG